uniref:NADH-ubiquinone oxidoreductase chain 4L n=1 Tax=Fabaeformiscandona kushiroensis TaxID=1564202 RepID=A0A0S3PNS6_9CRUS|nr:NADH dehydrogenase subunit 4L [Fabaeformiscandona kushiroensis]
MLFLVFFVVSGLMIFCSQHKHLLVTLLSLEYVMLCMFILLILSSAQEIMEGYMSLIFLVFAVSDGAVGLSILVVLARSHGSDYFKSFNLVW